MNTEKATLRCPKCDQSLRVPREVDSFLLTCPKCRHTWDGAARWYCKINGIEHGPLTIGDLANMASRSKLFPSDLVRQDPSSVWSRAAGLLGLDFGCPSCNGATEERPEGSNKSLWCDQCRSTSTGTEKTSSDEIVATAAILNRGPLHSWLTGFGLSQAGRAHQPRGKFAWAVWSLVPLGCVLLYFTMQGAYRLGGELLYFSPLNRSQDTSSDREAIAMVNVKNHIKRETAPLKPRFPWLDVTITPWKGGHRIESYYEVENVFGAELRHHYVAITDSYGSLSEFSITDL